MDANLNGGAWKRMENAWARALDRGSSVEVHGTVHYDSDSASRRPVRFEIAESVNGGPIERHRFRNRPGG
ncbi:DNA/RNA non-specific endonuclease [Micromonospora sp. NPDC049044]|uniref:DNA/RNA non-specific endonuclease n=1 Tax=unclassified Micromonospora TaxID=2617518 RepID=UPI0033CE8912